MKIIPAIFFIVVLVACGSTAKLASSQQSDADRGAAKYPGYTLADLNNGRDLFQQNCNRCHHLKDPQSRNEAKWNKIVPVMVKKLNKKEGKIVIDDQQQESILRYLVTMSSAPTK